MSSDHIWLLTNMGFARIPRRMGRLGFRNGHFISCVTNNLRNWSSRRNVDDKVHTMYSDSIRCSTVLKYRSHEERNGNHLRKPGVSIRHLDEIMKGMADKC